MKSFVSEYFKNSAQIEGIVDPFFEFVVLEKNSFSFSDLKQKVLNFPKGWFDLLQFSSEEKIEFVLNTWIDALPFAPEYHDAIIRFFDSLEDIGIVLIKEFQKSPYSVEMIYSLKNRDLFFRGQPPCDEETIDEEFDYELPQDYLDFFKIHSGFRKFDDIGFLPGNNLKIYTSMFQQRYLSKIDLIPITEKVCNPNSLVPFYEDKNGGAMCLNFSPFSDDSLGALCYVSKDFKVSRTFQNHTSASFLDFLCYYILQT